MKGILKFITNFVKYSALPLILIILFLLFNNSHHMVTINSEPVIVSVAYTAEARTTGLMHRQSLLPGQGMLFIFPSETTLSFWMKNTLIPLSIAFISEDRRIVDIQNMTPDFDKFPTKTYESKKPARFALEVPAGWFEDHGIAVGDEVLFSKRTESEIKKSE